jgi:hypothetical protein
MGVNYFADWTVEEFREKMLGVRMNKKKGLSSGVHLRLPTNIELPSDVDWRFCAIFHILFVYSCLLKKKHFLLELKVLLHQLKIKDSVDHAGQ